MPELLTPTEVAELLKVSRDSVLRWFGSRPGIIDLGSQEHMRRHKRRYRIIRIPRVELERFLRERGYR